MQNELHGSPPNMRIKWSCKTCLARNDHRVRTPPAAREVFVCRKCKKATAIGFEVKYEPPTGET